MKVCQRCEESKPLEAFSENKRRPDGFNQWCKACVKVYHHEHYERNKEAIKTKINTYYRENRDVCLTKMADYRRKNQTRSRVYRIKYYLEHRQEALDRAKRWAKANPERCRQTRKAHYWAHHDNHLALKRQYRKEHQEDLNTYYRSYFRDNRTAHLDSSHRYRKRRPEIMSNIARNYRARKRGAVGSYTAKQLYELCRERGWSCTYCGVVMTLQNVTADHMIPLSRGGSNDISNITPCCRSCNPSKGAKTDQEFLIFRGA